MLKHFIPCLAFTLTIKQTRQQKSVNSTSLEDIDDTDWKTQKNEEIADLKKRLEREKQHCISLESQIISFQKTIQQEVSRNQALFKEKESLQHTCNTLFTKNSDLQNRTSPSPPSRVPSSEEFEALDF